MKRRTFLRGSLGAGLTATLGLPVFEAMLDGHGMAFADGSPFPKRFVVWFWGNGNDPSRWTPAEQGADWQATGMLEGIADIKSHINLVTGTTLPTNTDQGLPERRNPHVEGAVGILTGGRPLLDSSFDGSGGDWNYMTVPEPSIDVLVANQISQGTTHKLLTTAVTTLHGVASGKPGTAVRYISHNGPYNINAPTNTPHQLFDDLFGNGIPSFEPEGPSPEALARASVLDTVRVDARALHARLGATDRARLDQHLTGLRELELKLRATPMAPPVGGSCAEMMRPESVESYRQRAQLFADVIAMAFACDLSRVATVEFSSPASHVAYPDVHNGPLEIGGSAHSFHEYQHLAGRDENVREALKYFVSTYGEFVKTMRAMPEGDGTLLDQSCILGTSEVSIGENHKFRDYPVLIAGGAGGALKYPGIHVRKGESVPTTQIIYTCLRAMGVERTEWGTDLFRVTEPISEITGPEFT